MRIRKTLIAVLALAIAVAFSPLADLQAQAFINPGSQPGTDTLTQLVKSNKQKVKKAKKKGRKHHGKRAKSKGPGKCGAYMYYSKKAHKCMDARKK